MLKEGSVLRLLAGPAAVRLFNAPLLALLGALGNVLRSDGEAKGAVISTLAGMILCVRWSRVLRKREGMMYNHDGNRKEICGTRETSDAFALTERKRERRIAYEDLPV